MNENLNLAEILKDYPKGTKLYSPLCGECTFVKVNDVGTIICKRNDKYITFTSKGYYMIPVFDDCECVLFPSKDQRDWSKWNMPFKDGDIVYNRLQRRICIYHYREDETPCISYCRYNEYNKTFEILNNDICIAKQDYRLATEEEKQKLFDVIKTNGYHWNVETKTLEKLITPKFKVGDKIKHKTTNKDDIYEISKVYDDSYGLVSLGWMICIKYQDDYELVLNKFDPKSLKTFDKVLGRDRNTDYWHANFFSHYQKELNYPCRCISTCGYTQCVPYNDDTKHLLATSNEAPEFYRYWED